MLNNQNTFSGNSIWEFELVYVAASSSKVHSFLIQVYLSGSLARYYLIFLCFVMDAVLKKQVGRLGGIQRELILKKKVGLNIFKSYYFLLFLS